MGAERVQEPGDRIRSTIHATLVLLGATRDDPRPGGTRRGRLRRQALLAFVRAHPGLMLSEIAAAFPIGWGALYHHLAILEKEGRIASRTEGRRRTFHAVDVARPEPRFQVRGARPMGAVRRRVAMHVRERPGLTVAVVAMDLGLALRVAYYHVERLVADGLLSTDRPGRYADLRATPALDPALAESPKLQNRPKY